MDWNLKRRTFEQTVALKIAQELTHTLGPIMPESLAIKSDAVCRIFSDALDQNGVVDESAAERVLHYVPAFLADMNLKFAALQRQLDDAVRQQRAEGSIL